MESSKENIEACDQLIERFQCLRFFDRLSAVSVQMLHEALLKACKDAAEAETVVDSWIRDHAEHPTPADLYQLAAEIRSMNSPLPTWTRPTLTKCSRCSDTGWERIEKSGTTGVQRCSNGCKTVGQYESLGGVA